MARSNKRIYAQLIDDERGHTLAAAGSHEAALRGLRKGEAAGEVGKLLAERADGGRGLAGSSSTAAATSTTGASRRSPTGPARAGSSSRRRGSAWPRFAMEAKINPDGLELNERVVQVNRVAKVVKGGRRFSFSALVVVGNEVDTVGVGHGKAKEVPVAIQKAVEDAKKNLFRVPKYRTTITHQVTGRSGAGKVLLKPASEGTGVIAGGGVRAVLELAGIRDILSKSLGTSNPVNLVAATVAGLKSLRRPEEVAALRGKTVAEVLGLPSGSGARATEAVGATPRPSRSRRRTSEGGS